MIALEMVRWRKLPALAAYLCAALGAHQAFAKCGPRAPYPAPFPSAVVPINPTIYLFNESERAIAQFWADTMSGKRLPVHVRKLGTDAGLGTYAVEIATTESFRVHFWSDDVGARRTALLMRGGASHDDSADYTVSSKFVSTGNRAVEIAGTEEEFWAWTCSRQWVRSIVPSHRAPAYKVIWADSAEDYAAHRTHELVVVGGPPEPDHGEVVDAQWRVKLGRLNCRQPNFEWDGRPIFVGLIALHSDGSETPLAARPTRIESLDYSKKHEDEVVQRWRAIEDAQRVSAPCK